MPFYRCITSFSRHTHSVRLHKRGRNADEGRIASTLGQSHGRQLRAVTLDRAASRYQPLDHRPRVAAGLGLMSEIHPQYSQRAISCMS
jgi:hypothetical protein